MRKKVNTKPLLKLLRKELRDIRKEYSISLKQKDRTPFDDWLGDNYYMFERELRSGFGTVRDAAPLPPGQNGLPRLYDLCLEICADGIAPDQEELTRLLSGRALKGSEADLLPVMLRCALLHRAWESCQMKSVGGIRGERAAALLGNAVKSLRNLPDIDFNEVNGRLSPVEKILMQDPVGVYRHMDEATKALYRSFISKRARESGEEEETVAEKALKQALAGRGERDRHIGLYILPRGKYRKRGAAFLIAEAFFPLMAAVLTAYMTGAWYLVPLLYLPFWEVTGVLVRMLGAACVRTYPLPRMEIKNRVPSENKTLIVVSTLLPGAEKAGKLKNHLKELYLSNGQENVKILLLADLKGAGTPEKPEDKPEIAAMERVIGELNSQYGGGFILAVRPRDYSVTQGSFTGWERKRGAITQLIREIKGETGGFLTLLGDTGGLRETKSVLALDADTSLPLDTAAALVSAAMHPLNRPVTDRESGTVTDGYGILAPSVGVGVGESSTVFSKILAGDFGITAYDNVSSERYQDFFGEGIFAGKGLIDVDAFYALLNDTLPEGLILSHDILEGGYLRCGFVSDLQVTDGFPKRLGAYFDRMERWIRGDWQNAGFIFGKNPLSGLSRFKLLDNLRRSLTPIAACLAVLLSVFMDEKAAAVAAAIAILSVPGGHIFSALRTVFMGGTSMFSRLFYSSVMPSALGDFTRGAALLLMLPQTAWVSICAIARAMWRRLVSKKKLLEWTTFAQSDSGNSAKRTAILCLPLITAAAVLLLSAHASARLCAMLFLSGVLFTLLSGRENEKRGVSLDYFTRDRLTSYAAAMWVYFDELCTKENNFLPPDNMQETPVHRTAHRTSPTNIGMMMMCVLAARDLGFIDSAEMFVRTERALNSIDRLEKHRGNLLNWYDTRTLRPLYPRYVSSVDSGNFLCSLVALKQGIMEYKNEFIGLEKLAARIEKLIGETDIAIFYNKRRRLLHIGLDMETMELSPSYYDLLMSEARMTGYYAVASKAIPKKHWGALGRTLVSAGRYTGLVSWTGTMFEYFMPYIFLPAIEGTLSYEALKFCVWCQKNRVAKKGSKAIPWGISESGFYAFDRQLNYQYKAHGVQKLGLKRGMNAELVISPYSTFLALSLVPRSALKNLKLFEEMEMAGRCGFYEAADFTRTRTNGQDYAVVRSYMAHHVGMSMLCVLNALKGNIIQKRFMSDDKMASGASLLHEKIPLGAAVFKDVETRSVPKIRERTDPQIREFETITPLAPHVKLLTNGEWTAAVTDVGASMSAYRGVSVLRHSADLLRNPQGVFALLKSDSLTLPVTAALGYPPDVRYGCAFASASVTHRATKDNIQIKMRTAVHPRLSGEQRTFTIRNRNTTGMLNCDLVIYFEPSLAPHRDAEAHPMFSKLFLEDSFDAANKILTFTRKPRNEDHTLSLAAGFLENIIFEHETSREKLLKCGYGVESLLTEIPELQGCGGMPDACAAFKIKVKLPPKGTAEVSLILAAASSKNEAVNKVLKMRESGGIKDGKGAYELFREGGLEAVIADKAAPRLLFDTEMPRELSEAVGKNCLPKNAVWAFGVSGDFPIILIEVRDPSDAARAAPYICMNDRLRCAGIMTDLVIGYREGGEYGTPVFAAISGVIKSSRPEGAAADGLYVVNLQQYGEAEVNALKAAASYIASDSQGREERPERAFSPLRLTQANPFTHRGIGGEPVKLFNFTDEKDDAIIVGHEGEKPCVPWCLVLSNSAFGTMVSDKALGFTWAVNARENKLTPWYNDARRDNRGEMLILKLRDKSYDLLLGAAAEFTPEKATWYGKAGEIEYEISVTVPEKGMVKNCELRLKNRSSEPVSADVIYYTEPVLGVSRECQRFIQTEKRDGGILMHSPYSEVRGYAFLSAEGGADHTHTDRAAFLSGEAGYAEKERPWDVCAAVEKRVSLLQGEEKTARFYLSWAAKKEAALLMKTVQKTAEQSGRYIRISSPDKALDRMVNSWLPWQIVSCRVNGRTGFYQCGGAWGFRDQLQDVSAMIFLDPALVRRHILRCCAAQFLEGDALHWWHRMPGKSDGIKGVRTRYSDDFLWLPYVTAEYVEKTGDADFLNVTAPFLQGDELSEEEHERYFSPFFAAEKGTVYEHCIRAAERAMRFGERGLALIGGGDWNDGFNKIGIKGRGESVWLTQFLSIVLRKTAALCVIQGDAERAADYRERSAGLLRAVDENAWAGDRYARAFFDDGTPLGVRRPGDKYGGECEIDSLPQSFAALAEMPDKSRIDAGMDTAFRELVDEEAGIIKLLSLPFSGRGADAGYITAYPPGVRENGGQYTHAAIWFCMALLRIGRVDDGARLLSMLNPARICEDAERMKRYRAEPYAIAGDVSANRKRYGHTGWSLYTGAAAWYYRAVCEELLGLRFEKDKLFLRPKITEQLTPLAIEIGYGGAAVRIELTSAKASKITVDGQAAEYVPLDGKSHEVKVE
ncbi:MAG: DUF3131 domain-containing protein [Oscillospiraceae bacterium]|nr:DUF3131 domain-containing protein [Oscillospiraceae bacterium]